MKTKRKQTDFKNIPEAKYKKKQNKATNIKSTSPALQTFILHLVMFDEAEICEQRTQAYFAKLRKNKSNPVLQKNFFLIPKLKKLNSLY